jgi:hypothetical protein
MPLSDASQSVSWVKEIIAQRPLKREEAEAASAEYVIGARESFEYFRCPTHAVTRTSRSSATGSIDNYPCGIFLH